MTTITRFEEIEAWQTARELTRKIYEMTNEGQFARDFGLKDQMRRASVSIMSIIAEGFESRTPALFVDYLGRAKASAGDYAQLYVALDVGYLDQANMNKPMIRSTIQPPAQQIMLLVYRRQRMLERFNVQRLTNNYNRDYYEILGVPQRSTDDLKRPFASRRASHRM
jgi:four helix bundle protein